MGIQEDIKSELLKELNTDIDKLYDFIDLRFSLDDEHVDRLIRELNRLKDEVYTVVNESELS